MAGAAINLRSVATVGKLRAVITQIWSTADPHIISASSAPHHQLVTFRRMGAAHASAYEKNIDEQVRPTDEVMVIDDKYYWAPHPHTGVFGPNAGGNNNNKEEEEEANNPSLLAAESVLLEEKAWFRPTSLEDLEKPASHH